MSLSPREQMLAEDNVADQWAAVALKAVIASVKTWRDCGRCNGKGYAHFLGNDRAPGICFGCHGKGKLISGRHEKARVDFESTVIELNRLRFAWVSANKAMKALVPGHRTFKYETEELSRRCRNLAERAEDLKKNLSTNPYKEHP